MTSESLPGHAVCHNLEQGEKKDASFTEKTYNSHKRPSHHFVMIISECSSSIVSVQPETFG